MTNRVLLIALFALGIPTQALAQLVTNPEVPAADDYDLCVSFSKLLAERGEPPLDCAPALQRRQDQLGKEFYNSLRQALPAPAPPVTMPLDLPTPAPIYRTECYTVTEFETKCYSFPQ